MTIRRDSKLAEAIGLLGEVSSEAKEKLLSGEVVINKAKLEALSSAPHEEIKALASEIEEGTYKRRTPCIDITSDSILPEIRQLNMVIRDFAINFAPIELLLILYAKKEKGKNNSKSAKIRGKLLWFFLLFPDASVVFYSYLDYTNERNHLN